MTKKVSLSLISFFMMIAMCFGVFTGCANQPSNEHDYNVIVTVASVPPVIASLESIQNGSSTYAYIERGKTYSGIDSVEQFEKIDGFNNTTNYSTGITPDMFNHTVATIQQILARDEDAFIKLYCVDYNAFAAYAMAMNAGLTSSQFKIIMIEDGRGAYSYIQANYVDGQASAQSAYENYLNKVEECERTLQEIAQAEGNSGYKIIDNTAAVALAYLDNFEYIVQSKDGIEEILNSNSSIANSNLYSVLKIASKNGVKSANIRYKSISKYVSELSAKQKEDYLTLMFGNDRTLTEELFSRTTAKGENVPTKKLVYIGGRVVGSSINMVKDMVSVDELVESYDLLNADYKEVFSNAEDYALIYNIVSQSSYSDQAKVNAMNHYMEYAFALKTTYRLYGEEYDILFKGHPRELVNDINTWDDSRYRVNIGTDDVPQYDNYKSMLYNMVNAFYNQDSEGKFIGILPGGVAAENFAYLDKNFALGGLSSSTYTGYETDVIVEFILSSGTTTIQTEGSVSARYNNGTLTWTKDGDTNYTTKMLNKGNLYKTLAEYYAEKDNNLKNKYETLLNEWLIANDANVTIENVANYTINRQGEIVAK